MRLELDQLEKISQYLNGEMDATQAEAFAKELSQSSDLKDLLSQQEDLIRAAKRKALRAEIQAVAAGGAGVASTISTGGYVLGSTLIIGLGAVLYFTTLGADKDDIAATHDSPLNQQATDMVDSSYYSEEFESEASLNQGQEELVMETPETIFSSVATYTDEGEENKTAYDQPMEIQLDKTADHSVSRNEGRLVIKEKSNPSDKKQVSDVSDYEDKSQIAGFPGGNIAMKSFMDKNLRYPKSAYNKGIEAVVKCDFQISEDGIIQNINAELVKMSEEDGQPFSDMRELFNKKLADAFIGNATHVLRMMPKWNPSTNSAGTPVISTQRMYFNYDLKRGCLAYQLSEDFELPIRQRE